jgi:hypothetical protein
MIYSRSSYRSQEEIKYDRRRFLGAAALIIVAAQFGISGSAKAQPRKISPEMCPRSNRRRTGRSAH